MALPSVIQARIKTILDPHFPEALPSGVTVLTTKPADIQNQILAAIGKLGYIILISTPGGRDDGSTATRLVLKQTYRISLVQSALYKGRRILDDDVLIAAGAIHGEPLEAGGNGPLMFAAPVHQLDATAPGLNIQHIDVEIKNVVPKPTPPSTP